MCTMLDAEICEMPLMSVISSNVVKCYGPSHFRPFQFANASKSFFIHMSNPRGIHFSKHTRMTWRVQHVLLQNNGHTLQVCFV